MVFSTVGSFSYARCSHTKTRTWIHLLDFITELVLFNWKNRLAEQWCSTVGSFTYAWGVHIQRQGLGWIHLLDSSLSWCSSIGRIDWCTLLDWGKYTWPSLLLAEQWCSLLLARGLHKDLTSSWAGALQLEESTGAHCWTEASTTVAWFFVVVHGAS